VKGATAEENRSLRDLQQALLQRELFAQEFTTGLVAKKIDRSGGCCLSRCGGGGGDDNGVESFLLQVNQVGSRSTRKVTKGGRKKKKNLETKETRTRSRE